MLTRFCSAVVLGCLCVLPAAAQTVRFDTNVGTFDLELNPTGNPNLQGHVDNMVAYVESGRYDLTVINRAAENFVMQMGGFRLNDSLELPGAFSDFPSVTAFDPVIVDEDGDGTVDFDVSNLLNTRGTVSLALSNNANTGTSSFFVNLDSNASLDNASLRFVPFAKISDMATIDLIMGLPQASLPGGGLASADIPQLENDRLVFVERAFLLDTDAAEAAALLDTSAVGDGETLGESLAVTSEVVSSNSTAALESLAVPEPPALVLAIGALMLIFAMKPQKLR